MNSDRDGFLLGTPTPVDKSSYAKVLSVWNAIKADTTAIRSALKGGGPSRNSAAFSDKQVDKLAAKIGSSVASARSNRERGSSAPAMAAAMVAAARPRRERMQGRIPDSHPEAPAGPVRGANGRFLPRGSAPTDSPAEEGKKQRGWLKRLLGIGKTDEEKAEQKNGLLSGGAGTIADGVGTAAEGAAELDPALMAVKELKDAVAPLATVGKGLFKFVLRPMMLAGRWLFKKGANTDKGKAAIAWQKKIWKELRELNKKGPGGEGGRGLMGAIAPLLAGLLPLAMGAIGALVSGVIASLPLLAVAAAGAIGFAIGSWINDKFGPQIVDAMVAVADTMKDGWAKVQKGWEGITGFVTDIFEAIAQKFGIATEFVGDMLDKGSEIATNVGNRASSAGGDLLDMGKNLIGKGSKQNRAALEGAATSAGITNPKERAMFMAQMGHESGGFRSMEESFNYKTPEQLMAVSATAREKGPAAVQAAMAAGPDAVAELMYGGRMGNTAPGDAAKFKGRGFTQLTGKDNYAAAGKALGVDLVKNPELASDPAMAGKIATWYWKSKGLSGAAQAGDVASVTKGINNGTNGIEDRMARYQAELAAGGGVAARPGTTGATAALPSGSMTVPAMAEVRTPIGAPDGGKGTTVTVMKDPVTQNVGDRTIAHVATGGMGGAG